MLTKNRQSRYNSTVPHLLITMLYLSYLKEKMVVLISTCGLEVKYHKIQSNIILSLYKRTFFIYAATVKCGVI